jgi:hypothetical protein
LAKIFLRYPPNAKESQGVKYPDFDAYKSQLEYKDQNDHNVRGKEKFNQF